MKIISQYAERIDLPYLFVPMTMALCLNACGGGGSDSGSSSNSGSGGATDSNPPTAQIQFPPPQSLTEADSITVRGTASDPEGAEITVVRINGIDATTTDEFATWSVDVPLTPGTNMLTVETGDIAQNSGASGDRKRSPAQRA